MPPVRVATYDDLHAALRAGWSDFCQTPALGMMVGAIYMVGGWLLIAVLEARELRGLTFPVIAGFALIGPFVATVLYELSRRREMGLGFGFNDVPEIVAGTARRQIVFLGFALMFWLAVWIRVGLLVYALHFSADPSGFWQMGPAFFTTMNGLSFLLVGHAFGFVFAAVAFCLTVVAFPFLLDRDADVITAVVTSFKTVLASPLVMGTWAVMIAVVMAVASIPLFLGFLVALPVLGHASWHLYRRLVAA
ncbi:MAG: DUF2189 domain-containing protein [Pseudomonadota bacterium]